MWEKLAIRDSPEFRRNCVGAVFLLLTLSFLRRLIFHDGPDDNPGKKINS